MDEPYYAISAINKGNTQQLTYDLMEFIDSLPAQLEQEEPEEAKVEFKWDDYHEQEIKKQSKFDDDDDDWDDWNEDDYDVEIIYRP